MNRKLAFAVAALMAVGTVCADESAQDNAAVVALLKEAAALSSAGQPEAAAYKAAEADALTAASPAARAEARTAAMNYWQEREERKGKRGEGKGERRGLRINSLFSDHAVLQRDQPIRVWGYAAPNRFVTVGFADQWQSAKTSPEGYFQIWFPAMKAGGPYEFVAFSDGASFKASDLYVGEVWIAGGQSNMEMPLTGYGVPVPETDYAALEAAQPVRLFKVERSDDWAIREDSGSRWMTTWKGNEKVWTAAGSFFAYKLARELDCPVGIVLCAYSGSSAEAWASGAWNGARWDGAHRSKQLTEDSKPHYAKGVGCGAPNLAPVMRDFAAHPAWIAAVQQPAEGRERPDFDDSAWKTVKVPSFWRETLTNCNGVAWFRRTVEISADWAGKDLTLALGTIDKHDQTYFNGVKVGETGKGFECDHWSEERVYPVPASAVRAGRATIAVRVYSFADGCGIFGPAEKMKLSCGDRSIPLAGDWKGALTVDIGERWGTSRAYRHNAHMLCDNMLSTVAPYAARGVIWYQGCSNAGRAGTYEKLMERVIFEWKARWSNPDLAFIQVLLAGYDPGKNFETIRAAQVASAHATGTDFVSAVDGGHANIHPPYKKAVGERLAAKALATVYGRKGLEADGPELREVTVSDGVATVAFDHAKGLCAKGGSVGGFEVEQKDAQGKPTRVAVPAEIAGETVKVTVPEGAKELFYAFKPNPKDANLYNAAGLPAVPFRVKLVR